MLHFLQKVLNQVKTDKRFRHYLILRLTLWVFMATQMIAWACFSFKSGQLNDGQFVVFSIGMMVGQTAAAMECVINKAWGTMFVQAYFFIFTLVGMIGRMS